MALAMDRAAFVAKRKALGFTQEKLSAVLHVNIYTVKKWEGGKRKIPPFMVHALAAIEAGLEPITEGILIEVSTDTGEDSD